MGMGSHEDAEYTEMRTTVIARRLKADVAILRR
jgi:hypothetical protein